MRHRIAAVSAAALLTLAGASGVAQAQPSGSDAPSAVVLTVAKGTEAETATLSCAPTVGGTHPNPQAACAELAATNGDFGMLLASPDQDRYCPMYYDPITVTMSGVWKGEKVAWKHTFSNACVMSTTLNGSTVFSF
ncbi:MULTISPECIES: subtilase-type protease inhibitor [Streptomyces]|uniref:Subtilase-type protease inhibitor n=1 Tax=Streptomyces sudanensis TaxID=436397 RepID=A0ABY4TCV0_9ACTN|nr:MULTISPECIES: subtilase-type protease inhibitor [Streptomyces]URN14642.1 subtilase-type protease inhibitor [Streptomyces sudanensis]